MSIEVPDSGAGSSANLPATLGAGGEAGLVPRPRGVALAGWFLVLANAVSLLSSCLVLSNAQVDAGLAQNHLPVEVQKLIGIVGRGGALGIGVLLLQGVGWGRWLYAGWGAVGWILALVNLGPTPTLIPSAVIYALILATVFGKGSTAFFRGREVATAARSSESGAGG